MSTHYKDEFGYLPFQFDFHFSDGKVAALPGLKKAMRWMKRRMHPDGYMYPPFKTKTTRRPALLQRVRSTHSLKLDKPFPNQEQARRGEAAFIMHLLGFLYGHRCHFHDWWLDGRVSLRDEIDHSLPNPQQTGSIISHALQTFRTLSDTQRIGAINVLFLHTRAQAYELEAERFSSEYQVFDGVYAVVHPYQKGQRQTRHKERIEKLCKDLGIRFEKEEKEWAAKIVDLRNKLLHETIWDGGMPGEARSEFSFYAALRLHKLTKRALLAALGFKGRYIESSWSTLSSYSFNIEPN